MAFWVAFNASANAVLALTEGDIARMLASKDCGLDAPVMREQTSRRAPNASPSNSQRIYQVVSRFWLLPSLAIL